LHGEGVSIGIILAYELSLALGLCKQEDIERVENHFLSVGLPTRIHQIENFKADIEGLISTMRRDKKARSGKMIFILTNGIGDTVVSDNVEEDIVRDVLTNALGGADSIDTTNTEDMKQKWKSAFSSQA